MSEAAPAPKLGYVAQRFGEVCTQLEGKPSDDIRAKFDDAFKAMNAGIELGVSADTVYYEAATAIGCLLAIARAYDREKPRSRYVDSNGSPQVAV